MAWSRQPYSADIAPARADYKALAKWLKMDRFAEVREPHRRSSPQPMTLRYGYAAV
jgi:hypothetical protein